MSSTTLIDILDYYNTEEECRELLEELKWPNGVAYSRCGSVKATRNSKRHTYECLECFYTFSITSGTALHKTHLPLRKWILGTYFMCASKKGMSAKQIERMLDVTYKTAWYLNHRIRNAIANVQYPLLSNVVEVDETFVGGKVSGKGQGYTGNKAIVIGIVERDGNMVLQIIENRTRVLLEQFVLSNIDPEIEAIFTDEWPAYRGLPKHDTVNHSIYEYARSDVHTNTVESIWSLLKRSIIGTFHHVSIKHLELYLEELAWRANNRDADLFHATLRELPRDVTICDTRI